LLLIKEEPEWLAIEAHWEHKLRREQFEEAVIIVEEV